LSADLNRNSQYQISLKSVNWERSCSLLTYGQTRQSWRLAFETLGMSQPVQSFLCRLCKQPEELLLDDTFTFCGATAILGPSGRLVVGNSTSHTITHTRGKTPLDEWSARHRGRYLHSTQHRRWTSIPSAGLEPAIPAMKRPQTFVLGRTATGIRRYDSRGQLKCDGIRVEIRFRLSAKRTSPFKSAGSSVQSTTGGRGVRISGSNAGYTMFRSSVKGTGYPLHSPVSPSLPLPCVTVCHHISTAVYLTKLLLTPYWIQMEGGSKGLVIISMHHIDVTAWIALSV
jgi:hypothetical protein